MSTYRAVSLAVQTEIKTLRDNAKSELVSGAYAMHKGIVSGFYSATPGALYGLARRTGAAVKSWQVQVNRGQKFSVAVFSAGVPYADMSVEKRIAPKEKKWLAIPVGAAKTKSGVPRYPGGPRQAAKALSMPPVQHGFRRQGEGERDPLRFYKRDANTAFLIAKDGVKGTGLGKNNRIMFVLKKSVIRPARTKLLMPWIDKRLDSIFNKIVGSK